LYSAGGDEVEIYSFDGATLFALPLVTRNYGNRVRSVAWSPDGRHLAVGGYLSDSGDELEVYAVDYRYDTTHQSFNNGIIFGDSSQPNDMGDLDVQVLAGARVNISGKVLDDSSF